MKTPFGAAILAAALIFSCPIPAGAAGTYAVETLVQKAAAERGAITIVDPSLASFAIGTDLVTLPEKPTYDQLRGALAAFDVVLVDDEIDGKPVVRAIASRNLSQRLPAPRVLAYGAKVPAGNGYFQKSFVLRTANPDYVAGAIRQEQGRDPLRAGSVTVLPQGTLVVADLAPALARYSDMIEMIEALDERTAGPEAGNVRLDVEVWSIPSAVADALEERLEGSREALAQGGTRLAELSGTTAMSGKAGPRRLTAQVDPPGIDVSLDAGIEPARGRFGVNLSMVIDIHMEKSKERVSLGGRALDLAPGTWSLVYSGAPGVAVLIRARHSL